MPKGQAAWLTETWPFEQRTIRVSRRRRMMLGPQQVRQALGRVWSGVRLPMKATGRFGFFERASAKADDRDMPDYVARLAAAQGFAKRV